ncbi:uncharacterized protein LOC127787327 [Diospyros lotus]|uniref:uncharacterized protein LOC127787327 n=1 Tax=Diospyros lotus TaxID=55363 RepID=UPI002252FC36|nr:uncharacterized protein LOC127787327 [Diospyros lotus]
MAAETKSTVVKVRPSNASQDASSKKKIAATSSKTALDHPKSKSTTTVSKTEVKGKTTLTSSKTTTKTTTVRTREKKVYSLPGQKHDVPEEREPLRIFYESLSKQIPSSEMAEFW